MDKNPDRIAGNLRQILEDFTRHNPNIILTSSPFHKTELANMLLDYADCPGMVLDFDLLYSGYVTAGMLQKRDDIEILRASRENWNGILHSILGRVSTERSMVVIDSFNGFHNMYDQDSARFVNASLMLLSYMAGFSGCMVVALAMARRGRQDKWVLTPGGRQIVGSKNSCLYDLREVDGVLRLDRVI